MYKVQTVMGGFFMENIYKDIAERTGGDIYIGVVGPVRTGKSTFIKKFMENVVVPNIADDAKKERTLDELPQSAGGKTIMTTEPKFIPNEAVAVNLSQNATMNVRLIDCVGYLVDGALGSTEEGEERMVATPWSDEEMSFAKAAEIGTEKVIKDHSTIGMVITTDGSITDIPRYAYEKAEERVVGELKELKKPFLMLLNSIYPNSEECKTLAGKLSEKYNVTVLPVNCAMLNERDISDIMEKVLFEFPLTELKIKLPSWVTKLCEEHYIKKDIVNSILNSVNDLNFVRDIDKMRTSLAKSEYAEKILIDEIDLGIGSGTVEITAPEGLFYKVLGEETGFEVEDEGNLITLMKELSEAKKKYDKLEYALWEVNETGYGIVSPNIEDLSLEEPEIVKQGGRFGVRLRASAPSIHMIRADISAEVSPVVGSEKQSQELVEYLLSEFESDPKKIWESNLFGKSLHELVNEGLQTKIGKMPADAREKLRETLEKIINEGSGGLLCIIL